MADTDLTKGSLADKKSTIIILQWVIVIATSFLILFQKGEVSKDPVVYGLIVLFLFTSLILYRIPESAFYHGFFDVSLLLWDTLILSTAIYVNQNITWELFLLYFFVLFLAAMGESMLKVVIGSVIINVVYIGLLIQQGKELNQLGSDVYVRISFLFGVSILYGYLSENTIKERRRAETAEEREHLKMGLVSALAHDIKNPLGIIMGYAELKLDEFEDSENGGGDKTVWNRVEDSGRRIVNLVTGFLEASKAESGRLKIGDEPVQVNRLLREAIQQQQSQVQKNGLVLELELDERLPTIRGDEGQIDRVFWNLIGNAIKFTRNGGKVKVSSRVDGDHICVSVEDTGVGISQEELPLLFSQFKRLKGSEKIEGTGLGLFIVKTIVEAHKGTVWAESPEGKGATFTIRVPIHP
jgi:signal transduction histidine kinase